MLEELQLPYRQWQKSIQNEGLRPIYSKTAVSHSPLVFGSKNKSFFDVFWFCSHNLVFMFRFNISVINMGLLNYICNPFNQVS